MTKLEKIERDIASLDKSDFKKLSDWIEAFKADQWDKQMESDVDAGRLDHFIATAKAEIASGKLRDL
jgi:ABC-type phosphate transport system auxiliary subunit